MTIEKNSRKAFPERRYESDRALIDAVQASPNREIEIEPERGAMPVREVPSMDQSMDAFAIAQEQQDIGARCAETPAARPSDHAASPNDKKGIPGLLAHSQSVLIVSCVSLPSGVGGILPGFTLDDGL